MRMIAGETPGWKESVVYLDGVELEFCYEANDEEGWARCHVPAGTPMDDRLEYVEGSDPLEVIRRGKVEIRRKAQL